MDRRKLQKRSNLHKNLINLGSQTSKSDSLSSTTSNLSQDLLTRKRKLINSNLEDVNDDLDSKISQVSSVHESPLKKKRCEPRILHDIVISKTKSNLIVSPEKPGTSTHKDDSCSDDEDTFLSHDISLKQKDDVASKTLREKINYTSSKVSEFTSPIKSIFSTPKKVLGKANELKSINLSPVKSFQTFTPVKDYRVSTKETSRRNFELSKKEKEFYKFVQSCGISIMEDNSIVLKKHPVVIKQTIKEMFNSKTVIKQDIIELIDEYLHSESNLLKALNDMEMEDGNNPTSSNCLCLVRMFLEIPELQAEISTLLLEKLNNSVLIADSLLQIPWARGLIHQYRFLDFSSDPAALFASLEQLLESCPPWFLKELILVLPDIISDNYHCALAEILIKLMEDNFELVNVILHCIANLTLGKEYLEEFKDKVLNFLKKNLDRNTIPSIIKFLLNYCPNLEAIKKTITILRNVELQPLSGEKLKDCYTNQLQISNAIKMNVLLSKNMIDAILAVVGSINKDPKPIDIVLLLHIFSTGNKKKNAENLMKQNIRSGFYRKSLLKTLYNDYKEVTRDLQPTAIHMASMLLKSGENVFVEFSIEWFRCQFINQSNAIHMQREILEKIILLMGNNDKTAKNALLILHRMAADEEERKLLQVHCNHLRILLEKMDNLDLEEVGTLCDLLHRLCTDQNSSSEALNDDLYVLFQKQLASAKPLIKSKGVLGAVMALKHLIKKPEVVDIADRLFKSILTSVKVCPRSKALFYDQLTQVLEQNQDINTGFLSKAAQYFEEEFTSSYMSDKAETRQDVELSPQFMLNDMEEPGAIHFINDKFSALVPITFRLLKTCHVRLSDDGNLNSIDALLGAPILMPKDLDIPEPLIIDSLIHCINWFREIISGFAVQNDPSLQERVLKRLDNLMDLQGNLCELMSLCSTSYQPPPCYFDHFPAPVFVRTEKVVKKKGKKGKTEKSSDHKELASWASSSALCSKNPAYFRKLDPKVACLLDIRLELHTSQRVSVMNITQVCFLINELLGMFENDPSESFIRDLVQLLPKICSKLTCIVSELREEDNDMDREAVKLLFTLITKIFNWKGFQSVTYNALLRDGLRTLAGQINESNAMLRSSKELVAESYKYFESLSDIATRISLALALITACQSLMKHSETYTQQYKDKQAKLAFSFLSLKWPDDRRTDPQYKVALTGLLNNWIEYEPSPLNTISTILEWLPNAIKKLEKPQDTLERLSSIDKKNFHLLYKKIFDGVIKGIKVSLQSANTDPERIEVWQQVALCIQSIVHICKTLKTRSTLSLFLRQMPLFLKVFLQSGMPVLECNLKYQSYEVTGIIKIIQEGTRYLHTICCDCSEKKDILLSKYVPVAKSVLEKLLYSVKGMLALNSSSTAFWMGNLINKNLDGLKILSQTSSEESSVVDERNTVDDVSSEILESDGEDPVSEECFSDNEYDNDI